ncbi:protein of unknown function DUF1697 [Beutenbergia cavernae DSM 12333]|uniref:Pyridoxamine 5-phosphate oxidase n=1 Tax=Beutenbergia cavernae (strain ATCC BAA-8 / DSM 12333 / CCUG 43141 / JCM 11478 / NBRC 16432 / NCIMB 13614 / HKI 0122) TaxID=471853 RepID=C5C6E3_BEUC1|nr:DUF1697 domain-containing protein [Beutenbergia cavernae]ACQ80349.1 protein of unknown function DUF1697 [Beutenbergia cavernae DSM 12333]
MTRYVALLRGVNVGGITVRSARLAEMARGMGLDDVRTVLASGNLVFSSDEPVERLKTRIESELSDTFGYDAWIVLTTSAHVAQVVAAYPFEPDREGHHAYVVFGSHPGVLAELTAEATSVVGTSGADEQVAPGDGVLYWECPKGSTLDTAVSKVLARKAYRQSTTNRNLRTLRKLT